MKKFNRALKLAGEPRIVGVSGTSVMVIECDIDSNITRSRGATVPTDGDAGYSVGSIFIDTGGGIGTTLYANDGSVTSCDFNVSLGGTGDITSVVAGAGMTGGATTGAATLNVINHDGKITVGADTIDITTLTIEESDLIVATTDALNAQRIARATYDFAVDGGATSSIGMGVTLPDNAIVTRAWYEVISTLTSSGDSATIALTIPTDDVAGIVAATAIDAGGDVWDAGYHEAIQDGTAAAFSVKTTAARELTVTIAVEAVTAGAFVLFCEYVVSD